MKNAIIGVLVIVVVALSVVTFLMYQKVETLSTDVCDLRDQIALNEVKLETVNTDTEEKVPESKKVMVKFDPEKMKIAAEGVYEAVSSDGVDLENIGVKVTIEEGKAYVTTEFDKEDWISQMYSDAKEVENQEIKGFSGKPVLCFMAVAGQDINPPTLCFLMDDGTVEYVNSKDMLTSEKYEVEGKLGNLKDIVSFEYVSVSDPEGGGYVSTVAIDEEGYSYDIFEIVK